MKKSFKRLTAAIIALTMIGTSMPANVEVWRAFDVPVLTAAAEDTAVSQNYYISKSWNAEKQIVEDKRIDLDISKFQPFIPATSFTAAYDNIMIYTDNDENTWYYVRKDAELSERLYAKGRLVASITDKSISIKRKGSLSIILADGVTLKLPKGIGVNDSTTLNIYGQEKGSGKIIADSEDYNAAIGSDDQDSDTGKNGCGAINIYGGTIVASSGDDAAGIGGGNEAGNGNITIYGGNVTANGGCDASGIGTGDEPETSAGSITIYGGKVKATGKDYAAGIGGGDAGSAGDISIYGGTVSADGGKHGAGIGSGEDADMTSNIYISDGTVDATGGTTAAGIGGGSSGDISDASVITINGGDVCAKAGVRGAGIGAGGGADFSGTVNINGGNIIAFGGGEYVSSKSGSNEYAGAGIGAGSGGDMTGVVNIKGGTIHAAGPHGAPAIGAGTEISKNGAGGEFEGTIRILGGSSILESYERKISFSKSVPVIGRGQLGDDKGTFELYSGASVKKDGNLVAAGERFVSCRNDNLATACVVEINPCEHKFNNVSSLTYSYKNSTEHIVSCKYCETEFPSKKHVMDSKNYCSDCGYQGKFYTISFDKSNGTGSMESVPIAPDSVYVLPECTIVPPRAYGFKSWSVDGVEKNVGDKIKITSDITLKPVWVHYNAEYTAPTELDLTYNGQKQQLVTPGSVTAEQGTMYYVVDKDGRHIEKLVKGEGKKVGEGILKANTVIMPTGTLSIKIESDWSVIIEGKKYDPQYIFDYDSLKYVQNPVRFYLENGIIYVHGVRDGNKSKAVDDKIGYKNLAFDSLLITDVSEENKTITVTKWKYNKLNEWSVDVPEVTEEGAYKVWYKVVGANDYGSIEPASIISTVGRKYSNGRYSVDSYKARGTYPTEEGKVFAGWFSDNEFKTPYSKATGRAYAKFIDEKCITVKWQAPVGFTDNDSASIRLVSTLDNGLYENMHITLSYASSGDLIVDGEITHLYDTLNGFVDGEKKQYRPQDAFCNDSKYFGAFTVTGMPKSKYDTELTAQVYLTTLDGTRVEGKPLTFRVSDDKSGN